MVIITGRKIEAKPDEVIIQGEGGSYAFLRQPRQISPLITEAKINPEEYALVQEGKQANPAVFKANSAMSMIQRNSLPNGKNHLDTNVEVLSSGLIVPRASKLVTQIINVNNALNKKGVLYDASGKLIEGKRLEDYAHVLNHDCWVWLNESFEKGDGFLDLDVVYITGLENGKPVFQKEPLQFCLEQDCYADLESINSQGLLTKKSPIQKYEPGKSVYFTKPIEGRAVGFGAVSGDADLNCGRDPQSTDAWLGVFDCAESASAEKSGDTK